MQVSKQYIFEKLSDLDPSKCTGLDGVPAKFLKDRASILKGPVAFLGNQSISTSTVPSELKVAKVVPLFKNFRHTEDPNADTEWNDVLRAKGILPPKQETEISEDDIVTMVEQTIQNKTSGPSMDKMNLEELNEIEDDIDEEEERIFEQYRRQRLAEMQAAAQKARYGSVTEITKTDYVTQVNNAGDGVWVVVHVYKDSIPLCKLLNQHLCSLARKFPATKFVKSVSTVCIPNYPDKNLPTIFVYHEGDLKKQWIGPHNFNGMNCKQDEVEWMLGQVGAVKSELEENPRKEVKDVMSSITQTFNNGDNSDDDW